MGSNKKHIQARIALARASVANGNVVPLRPRALARGEALARASRGRKTAFAPEIVEGLAKDCDLVFAGSAD